MRTAVLIFCLIVATPAFAETPIAVSLSHDEAQTVLSLLDGAVKSGGLQAAKSLAPIADKILDAGRVALKADHDAEIKAAVDKAKTEPEKPKP